MGNPLNWNLGFGFDLGQFGSSLINYFSQKETNKANRELAELAYQQNVEQWERENAYNHPSEQMARLQEAGLNPNLVYGSGSAVQTSAHSPQMSYPQMQAPQMNFSTPFTASPLTSSQITVNESLADLNRAKMVESIANSNNLDAKTKEQLIRNIFAYQREGLGLIKLQKEIKHFEEQWKVFSSQVEVNKSVVDLNEEQKNKILAEIRKLGMDLKQAEALYDKWYRHGLTPAQGYNQLLTQLGWLGLQMPGEGQPTITVNDGLSDEEFEEKHGYKRYSPKWWGEVNKQSQYNSGNRTQGWSSIY